MADVLAFRVADDNAERQLALDTARSFIVEAPAGSGKTGLLLQRLLKLLALPGVTDPGQVLAITFTRKATHELRDRVLDQLAGAAAGRAPGGVFDTLTRPLAEAVLERDRALGWNLVRQPHLLNIRTIDSVSSEIARALPVLSGSGGALTPADDADELYDEAAHRTVRLLGGQDRALTAALETVLLHRDGNLAECRSLIAGMLAWRDQWGDLIPLTEDELDDRWLDENVLPRFERTLDLAICQALTAVQALIPPADLDRLCALTAEMAAADGLEGGSSPIALCHGRRQAPEARADHLDHWRALLFILVTPSSRSWRKSFASNHIHFSILKAHKQEIQEIIAELGRIPGVLEALCALSTLPPARYPLDQWQVAKALFRVLRQAMLELQLVFSAQGMSDFTEQSLLARHALSQRGALDDLAFNPAMNLQHLLVDEMQDTSSGQYDLIERITGGWDGHSQTVFLVGDPKQSIYLFRQARVERFLQTLHDERLGELHLTRLNLTANFRSQAALVEDFNHDFLRVFAGRAAAGAEVVYRGATASRPVAASGPARTWHTAVLPYERNPELCRTLKQSQAERDADEIRRLFSAWQARPLPPGRSEPWKLAVLVRARTHLAGIVRALRQEPAVPYRAVEIEPLGERQEILDLQALTRALLHPADRTAWLALLRSPLCGLGLADLHTLAGDPAGHEATMRQLLDDRAALLSVDAQTRIGMLQATLEPALQQRGLYPLAQWVERTWRSFGAHRFLNREAASNAVRFLDLLAELETPAATLDLDRLAKRLGRLYAAPSVHPGAVDLMTIHGAKGLEWDAVCVPALEAGQRPQSTRLLTWLALDIHEDVDAAPGILAPIQSKGTAGRELNAWMRSVEDAREDAERKRLFYVACTRAREELHLFTTLARKANGELAPPVGSLLASAWPAAEEVFQTRALAADLMPAEPTATPPSGTLERMAASAEPQEHRGEDRAGLLCRIPPEALQPTLPAPDAVLVERFERPQGSFAARTTGNTLHSLLELLARRLAAGDECEALRAELPAWSPRVHALLRAGGIGPAQLDRSAAGVLLGLTRTLDDPDGRWVLMPHPAGTMEQAFTVWREMRASIRMDRTFLAGSEPHAPGTGYLWIVDYKTATHGPHDLDAFLAEQRQVSAPQLESYAAELATPERPVRLALYYPLLGRMEWWAPAT